MTVRSAQLAGLVVTTAAAYVTVYTCPSDTRTIVKDLRLVSYATVPQFFFANVKVGADRMVFLIDSAAVTNRVVSLSSGFIMLEAGDLLEVFIQSTTGGGLGVLVGGAELQL